MKKFFSGKWIKKIFIFLGGGLILVILLWYFFGDILVFSYLEQSSHWGDYCHEDCMFTRNIAEQSLVYLANHRPWVKNKILNTILNQNQPGGYRVILLNVYEDIIGKENPMPDKIVSLIKDEKTPPELKSAIIYKADNNKQSLCVYDLANEWQKIAFNTNEDWAVRDQAVEKLAQCQGEKAVPFLVQLISLDYKDSVGLRAVENLVDIFRDKELEPELANELEQLVYNRTIHPDIREAILDVFYFSSNKELARNFLLKVYEDKNINILVQDWAAVGLNRLAGQEIYKRIKFTYQEGINFGNNMIIGDGEAWYPSEEEWLKKIFPDRYGQ